ncbi:hypothetical protein Cob_v008365 [Colletotrichum orbiculare MAFF 240422]|uniref:Uncharacterized protein n=1 Tax=Colletotrichum orbiculare (strain 104-T / ATCC 96160 / CBS 514.97 / LARS 414 / MAFF 240422) TaxID=1213857 RepID=A0A484FKM1_COLOR|nr:hypothetical protein Cob_v008365 [Colletotrichum orbiculare MAFF 240422]
MFLPSRAATNVFVQLQPPTPSNVKLSSETSPAVSTGVSLISLYSLIDNPDRPWPWISRVSFASQALATPPLLLSRRRRIAGKPQTPACERASLQCDGPLVVTTGHERSQAASKTRALFIVQSAPSDTIHVSVTVGMKKRQMTHGDALSRHSQVMDLRP